MMRHTVALMAFITLLAGCGNDSAAKQQVRSAASYDLSCDEAQIEFIEEEPTQIRVQGCGRTMTYMKRCKSTSRGGGAYGGSATPGATQECRWRAVPDERDNTYN